MCESQQQCPQYCLVQIKEAVFCGTFFCCWEEKAFFYYYYITAVILPTHNYIITICVSAWMLIFSLLYAATFISLLLLAVIQMTTDAAWWLYSEGSLIIYFHGWLVGGCGCWIQSDPFLPWAAVIVSLSTSIYKLFHQLACGNELLLQWWCCQMNLNASMLLDS